MVTADNMEFNSASNEQSVTRVQPKKPFQTPIQTPKIKPRVIKPQVTQSDDEWESF